MINGDRIRLARELRGLTQTRLAERVQLTQGAIAQIEGGRVQPSDELVDAIAFQTGFLPSFFRQESAIDFPLGSLLFRKRASMTATQEKQVHHFGQVMFEIVHSMADRLDVPSVRLPRDRSFESPREAARATRSAFGLSPETPIPQLINATERGGVLVLALPHSMQGGDAFSVWAGADRLRPAIVISGEVPGDRLRLSVAHELGHLVMHQAPQASVTDIEREAFAFAGELLLPAEAMREQITAPVTLTSIAELKPRWGVSIQALIRRAYELEIISRRQYTYLFEQLSARGWRMREPRNLDVPVERPRAIRQMAELLYGKPINYQRLGADVGLPARFVREIIEAHAARGEQATGTVEGMSSLEEWPETDEKMR